MEAFALEWLNLFSRWIHLITGIAWIGASFYFVWLDDSLEEPRSRADVDRGVVPQGRQPDTETFRYYEIAGAAHLTVHKDIELIPAGWVGPGPLFLEDVCLNEMNTTADGPVFSAYVLNALWERMQEQNRTGAAPPPGIVLDQTDGVLHRDALGNVTGGLSGPAIKPVALAMVWKVYQAVDVPLMGIGGIAAARDALEFIVAGATAVQVGTASFVDPNAGVEVVEGMRAYCEEQGIDGIRSLVGSLEI